MRLFIQIPCYNEAATLPDVLASVPRRIRGIDQVRVLVVDDGSTDGTSEVALTHGADYVVRNARNLGLARTFAKGLEACLYLGADLIINMDGDGQHRGEDIRKLLRPILQDRADMVVGARNFSDRHQYTWFKASLENFGTVVTRHLSGTDVRDATCGFRALTRAAALRTMPLNDYTYTLEMIIQAGRTGMAVTWAPVAIRAASRESRLLRSMSSFVVRQMRIMVRTFLLFCPMVFFSRIAAALLVIALLAAGRLGYYLWFADPSMIKWRSGTSAVLLLSLISALLVLIAGLLGTVLSGLRQMLLDVRARLRNMELARGIPPLDCEILQPRQAAPKDQVLASRGPQA